MGQTTEEELLEQLRHGSRDGRVLGDENFINGGTYVEALLGVEEQEMGREEGVKVRKAHEVFSGEEYVVKGGKIRAKFGPYETKAFLSVGAGTGE